MANLFSKLLIVSFLFTLSIIAKAENLTINGVATFQELNKSYYVASLELPQKANDPEQIKMLPGSKLMRFTVVVPKWSSFRYANQWNRLIILNNSNDDLNKNADDIFAFTELAKNDLIRGDLIEVYLSQQGKTEVKINKVTAFSTKNSDLFNIVLNTWVGKKPPSTTFKQRILGVEAYDPSAYAKLTSTTFNSKRAAKVKSWFSPKVAKTPEPKKAKPENQKPKKAKAEVVKAEVVKAKPEKKQPKKSEQKKAIVKAEKKVVKAKTEPKLGLIPNSESSAPVAATTPRAIQKSPVISKPKPVPAPIVRKPATQTKTAAVDKPKVSKAEAKRKKTLRDFKINVIKAAYKNINYPEKAVVLKLEGKVLVNLEISRSGKLRMVSIAESSGHYILDQTGIMAVKETSFPKVPASLDAPVKMAIPFKFKM